MLVIPLIYVILVNNGQLEQSNIVNPSRLSFLQILHMINTLLKKINFNLIYTKSTLSCY